MLWIVAVLIDYAAPWHGFALPRARPRADERLDAGRVSVGFLATASFWWIYFGRAEEAARTIANAEEPTHVGRGGYAYAHGIMVAGVIVLAVAIDLTYRGTDCR